MQNNGVDLTKLVVIAFESDLKARLLIEQEFAEKYNAKYWHPQPGTFQCPGIDDPNAIGNDYTPIVHTLTCEVCNNTYESLKDANVKVFPGCRTTLSGEGKCLLRCKSCGSPFNGIYSHTNYCPACNEEIRTFTCELCNNNYQYIGDNLDRYAKGNVKVCPICEVTLTGEGIYLLRCKGCNSPFKANGNITNYCPSCDEKRRIFTCEICCNNYKYTKNSPGSVKIKVCSKCEKTLLGTGNRIVRCRTCNSPFKAAGISANCCPACDDKRRFLLVNYVVAAINYSKRPDQCTETATITTTNTTTTIASTTKKEV